MYKIQQASQCKTVEAWDSRLLKSVCGTVQKIPIDIALLVFTSALGGLDRPAASHLGMNPSTHWTGDWWAAAMVCADLS